jgi:hypothetical protein
MNGKVKILFFCTVFVAGRAFCQKPTGLRCAFGDWKIDTVLFTKPVKKLNLPLVLAEYKKSQYYQMLMTKTAVPIIPSNYYTANFSFFCKKELQLEKITAIPFKFRLGSVQQCDRLEGKNTPITQ